MPKKKSIETRGKKPLEPGADTKRVMTNLGESLFEKALSRAGNRKLSAYLRDLVEDDVKKAS